MGFFDRLLDVIRLNDDEYYADDYNEVDEFEEDDEDDSFADDRPRKRFWEKFPGKAEEADDAFDEEDDDDGEDEEVKKTFSIFGSRKASMDEEDEDYDDYEEEDEPIRKTKARSSYEKKRTGVRERQTRTRTEPPRREYQSSYQTVQATADRISSSPYSTGYERNDWSTLVTEKPARSTRPEKKKRINTGFGGKVEVIRPESMEDTQDIAETLMANSTVVINLEGIDVDTAQRIIDFSCGACYSLNGGLQKVSTYFYILTPENVSISGDFTNMLTGDFDFPSMRSQY